MHTFGTGPNRQEIPREWELQQPKRLHKAIDDLEKLTPIVTSNYESLIKLGRRKLYSN